MARAAHYLKVVSGRVVVYRGGPHVVWGVVGSTFSWGSLNLRLPKSSSLAGGHHNIRLVSGGPRWS